MRNEDLHPSDQELLALADGELSIRRESELRMHTTSCWSCRARMAETEQTIAQFLRTYSGSSARHVPPSAGPRSLLKARLTQISDEALAGKSSWRIRLTFPTQQLIYSALAGLVLLMVIGLWRNAAEHRHGKPSSMQSAVLPIPDTTLTPGAVHSVSLAQVCSPGRSDKNRNVSVSIRQAVFEKYGLQGAPAEDYEVDYLITPELGGTDDIRNLWPQPYSSTAWNAYVKDALEDRLHQLVCAQKIELSTAQREIATDWIGAYKKYFHTETPVMTRGDSLVVGNRDAAPQAAPSPTVRRTTVNELQAASGTTPSLVLAVRFSETPANPALAHLSAEFLTTAHTAIRRSD